MREINYFNFAQLTDQIFRQIPINPIGRQINILKITHKPNQLGDNIAHITVPKPKCLQIKYSMWAFNFNKIQFPRCKSMTIKKLYYLGYHIILFYEMLSLLISVYVFIAIVKFLHRLLTDEYLFYESVL